MVIGFIKRFGKVYRAEISRVTCFDILINNITILMKFCGVEICSFSLVWPLAYTKS